MTRNELIRKANEYRKAAAKSTPGERTVLLKKARNYFADAGLTGLAAWCERHMG